MANGTYYYKEISAPDGYIVDSTMKEFKITEENKIAKETVTNKKIRGTLEITKLDDSRVAIEGVKFNILASDKKTVIETLTTDKSGHATTKKLDKGTYYYQEIEVPDGYVKDDEIFEFQINKQNEVVKREVINKRITGNLNVIKVDDNNTPIKGVKFEIYDANKNKVDTITTDENGKAASKDLQIGTYTYKEVSVPKGYVIDENEYEFAVTSKETKIEKTVVNNRAKGALKIIKLEKGTKTPIEGVTFEILDENKNVVDTIVTNKDGIAEKQDLIVGKYYYREISAPDKYIVDSKEKSFKLTDNGEIFEATVYNEAKTLPVTGGSLSLDMLIVLMVAGFSIVGFTTMKVVKGKKEHNL